VNKSGFGYAPQVADFNGDGRLDFVVYYFFSNNGAPRSQIDVYLGNGDGTFQAAHSLVLDGMLEGHVIVGDFNNDGKLDLLTMLSTSTFGLDGQALETVSVRLGNGDGTFQPAQNFPAGPISNQAYLFVGDFNGDGWLDVAVSRLSEDYFGNVSETLWLLLNDGHW
jgi:hypothetical protein